MSEGRVNIGELLCSIYVKSEEGVKRAWGLSVPRVNHSPHGFIILTCTVYEATDDNIILPRGALCGVVGLELSSLLYVV